jgi:metal-responsive CopG/Arc/MetJ family transcriptional regulator
VKSPDSRAGVRKVTYSLPARLVSELDRRTARMAKSKSAVVGDALALYFAEADRRELLKTYQEAAQDPLFQADNEAVLQDFAALDAEAEQEPR